MFRARIKKNNRIIGEQIMYYEDKQEQWADDCTELNQIIGEALDDFEDKFEGEQAQAVTTEVVPVVLAKLMARHFRHFYYDEPEDILKYLNYLKDIFVDVCDDKDELDMIKQVDYLKGVQA
jgi:hypothetical protein